jgi:hypothetical protein
MLFCEFIIAFSALLGHRFANSGSFSTTTTDALAQGTCFHAMEAFWFLYFARQWTNFEAVTIPNRRYAMNCNIVRA